MTAVADFKNTLGRIHVENLGIYVHVPFCRVRCRFCAFYMEMSREDRVQTFLEGLDHELCLYARDAGLRNIPVHTIYFGGGTPTTLTSQQLIRILNAIRHWFAVEDDAEVSIEVHPGTVTPESLATLRQAGFTRLSVGGQSFDQNELRELGGRVFGGGVRQAISWARSAGFTNISLDLMFGFPGQSIESWQRTLDEAFAVSPTHLSCYAYTLEEGSPFYREVMRGKDQSLTRNFRSYWKREQSNVWPPQDLSDMKSPIIVGLAMSVVIICGIGKCRRTSDLVRVRNPALAMPGLETWQIWNGMPIP